jgi:tetratricopeptide (TPR) repeat protein
MNDDINQQILIELRKLRQISQRMSYFTLILVVAAVAFIAIEHQQRQNKYPWDKVDTAWYQQDYPKALSLAQAIVAQQTNYYYGHQYLGNIYLAMNDLTNAEVEYSRAYQLFPNKEREETLESVQKRITMEHSEQSQSK